MAQWVNRLRNKIFVNAPPLPLLCEISGSLHLAQPGLTAGWLAGRPSVRPADEIHKRNRHCAVGKLSSEQHFHKSAAITFIV